MQEALRQVKEVLGEEAIILSTQKIKKTSSHPGLLDGSRRALYEERLEYTADILWRADRVEQAQWALAAAMALSQDSSLPVEQHPFLRAVIDRSLDLAVTAEKASPGGTLPSQGAAKGADGKTNDAEEYVDAIGLIRRKSGLILPR